jgi:uncharacterized membrane protein
MQRNRDDAMSTDPKPTADLHGESKIHDLGFERLVFFSDAVFAIAITLLVLDLKLQTGPQGQILFDRLVPKLIGFVISFSVTAFYWLAHHRLFKTLRAEDPWLRAVNLVFLACVVFLAFPSSVVSEYVAVPWAVIFYALSVATTGLMLAALVLVSRRPTLMMPGETKGGTLRLFLRSLGTPMVFIITGFIAPRYPLQAMLCWMTVPLAIRGMGWIGIKAGHRLDRVRP